MKFVGPGFHNLQHEQDKQTDWHDWMHYRATFNGGSKTDTSHEV